jgi:uncharacterized LabA/DUF88 family protein
MRAAIFIDGGYLLKRMQEAGLTADYHNLSDFLLAPLRKRVPLDLLRCYFYDCAPYMSHSPTDSEKRRMAQHEQFVAALQDLDRWQVRLGKLEKRRDGDREVFAQKRVDVQLSVDLVRHAAAGHIQHAVILAGDSDFIPAIVAAKESGATVSIWCDRDTVHRDLMNVADEVQMIELKSFPQKKGAPRAERPTAERAAPSSGRGRRRPAAAVAAEPAGDAPPPAPLRAPAPVCSPALACIVAPVAEVDGNVAPGDAPKKKRRRGRRGGRGRGKGGGGQGGGGEGAV